MEDGVQAPVPDRGAAEPQDGAGFPWPPAPDASVLEAFARTWRESVLEPSRFFARMPVGSRDESGGRGARAADGPGGPFVYYLAVGVLATGIGLFWQSVFTVAGSGMSRIMGASVSGWLNVISFLFSPVLLTLALVLLTGVLHLSLLAVGGARNGIGTTFRALCFTNGPALFAIVPGIGGLVGAVWGLALTVIGLREVHRTDTWRAVLAVLLPIAGVFAIGAAVMVVALLVGLSLGVG